MSDIIIEKGQSGLGRTLPSDDNIRGFITNGGTTQPAGLAYNTAVKLYSLKDAENLGIDKDYDVDNHVLVHYHISEFFRLNKSGKLWLMLVPQATTMAAMVDAAVAPPCPAKEMIRESNGEVRMIGIGRNPATGYTPVVTSGLDSDILLAVPKAQALSQAMFDDHMPCDFIIEGRSYSGNASSVASLRGLESPNVSVVIGQDLDVANNSSNQHPAHACIGTILGATSLAKVNENIGWVEKFNLVDRAQGRFLNPGLSNNGTIKDLDATTMTILDDKGFIFIRRYVMDAGVYFNYSHTCVTTDSDYCTIENNQTMNKAAREVYRSLLPKINAPVRVSDQGTLPPEVVRSFESLADSGLLTMQNNEEISARDVYIDPAQDIVTTSELGVDIEVVPIGVARVIRGRIGFTTRIA